MRKRLMWTLAIGAVFAIGVAAVAAATTTTIVVPPLKLTFSGGVAPKALPKKTPAPVSLSVSGKIETLDGSHPPALREAIVDIDKNGGVNTKGVPVCKGSQLVARNSNAAKAVCGKALVGEGKADAEIAFPESKLIKTSSPLLVFNGGTKGSTTTMYIHTFLTVPVPAAIVTTITIQKIHNGRYGLHTISKIPVIAGGSGSAMDFNFTIGKKKFTYKGKKHTYLEAKCPDGHFNSKILKAIFKNEAETPGQPPEAVLSGSLVVPCTPKG
jgi:hypothetical protein